MRLGKYELHEVIGKGGFGTVYRATDLSLEREVAIKVLHPQLTVDTEFVARFQKEARLMAQLENVHVVPVYGLEEIDGRFVIVMKLIKGGSLADLIKQGPIPYERAMQIMGDVCAGLGAAHQQGYVHRDMKPGNILLGTDGHALVSDFGLARSVQTTGSTSSSLGVAGTPFYRAPELWRGKPPASPATDVYALGCIFYEMLTGRVLFSGDTPDEVLTKHLIDGPEFGADWPPAGIPEGVAEVIQQALEREAGKRPADANAFYQGLQEIETVQTRKAAEEAQRQRKQAEEEEAQRRAEEKKRLAIDAERQARIEEQRLREEEEKKHKGADRSSSGQAPGQPDQNERPVQNGHSGNKKNPRNFISLALILIAVLVILTYVIIHFSSSKGASPMVVENTRFVENTVLVEVTREVAVTSLPSQAPTMFQPTQTSTNSQTALGIGSTKVSAVGGMVMDYVPAGSFLMGSDPSVDSNAQSDEEPQHTVTLDAYWIDQTDVTNGMYALCVQAGACQKPEDSSSNTRSSYYGNSQYSDYPVINVTWTDANAYCLQAGRSLPTEAQWEKAARGTDGRLYPWENQAPTTDLANFNQVVGDTTRVGSYPDGASPYGALDMAGNVWDWVADWYSDTYYQESPASNPTGPTSGEYRVLRGGSWYYVSLFLRSANRRGSAPDLRGDFIGFRCAVLP